MSTNSHDDQEGELPPPGSRWGSGAHTVLPYLTKSLQAKPANGAEQRESKPRDGHHPVFADNGRPTFTSR